MKTTNGSGRRCGAGGGRELCCSECATVATPSLMRCLQPCLRSSQVLKLLLHPREAGFAGVPENLDGGVGVLDPEILLIGGIAARATLLGTNAQDLTTGTAASSLDSIAAASGVHNLLDLTLVVVEDGD